MVAVVSAPDDLQIFRMSATCDFPVSLWLADVMSTVMGRAFLPTKAYNRRPIRKYDPSGPWWVSISNVSTHVAEILHSLQNLGGEHCRRLYDSLVLNMGSQAYKNEVCSGKNHSSFLSTSQESHLRKAPNTINRATFAQCFSATPSLACSWRLRVLLSPLQATPMRS